MSNKKICYEVSAGQVYRSRNRTTGHWRYIRIERVHGSSVRTPSVTAREITRTGKPAYGRSHTGFKKSKPFPITLTWIGSAWGLRGTYERWADLDS